MTTAQSEQPNTSAANVDFSVTLVACGPITHSGGLVWAIVVTQPVQSWTVIRSHEEFRTMGESLSQFKLPPCPAVGEDASSNFDSLVETRNELQAWLSTILMHPSARESPHVRNFLIHGANMMPARYETVAFTPFNQMVAPQTTNSVASGGNTNDAASNNLDDMDMDDMFFADAADDQDAPHEDREDDEDMIPPASERYQQTDEAVTDEDEMELMDLAGEVEMIEDIGSLAQSLGASHLGRCDARSLQLQVDMQRHNHAAQNTNNSSTQQKGLVVGGSCGRAHVGGGIGSVMARAAENGNTNTAFNSMPMQSAPKLDSFKLLKVIGKGSFGKVFLVNEKTTGQIYALKVLQKDNIIKRNQVEHTKTERSVLGYVRHPFIVGMNMAFQSRDKLYFVLDYCAGGELFFHLGKIGKFPEPRARFYAAEIILALSYIHSLDIIYRDLKPENVLLDAEGHIRLTDFGLSKEGISGSSSGANSFCGTPEYLAPEILNREGHGRAVDWWSLGALLYELIGSLPPFYCQDRQKLFERIKHAELAYPSCFSPPAESLLRGLLTKDPKKRLGSGPTDADEIKYHQFFNEIDWEKLMRGEMTPPWRPNIQGTLDTSQFDKEFTSMPVFSPQSLKGMHMRGFGTTPVDNTFEGFTFTDRRLHGPGAQ